jgi:site-specific DNA recombinase
MLEQRGISSPTGRPQWTATAIRETMMRSIYSGTGTAYATVTTRRPGGGFVRRVATPDERTLLPGIAPPIVTPQEHALVQSILERNKANAIRNNRDPVASLLRAGYVRCGHCGWTMGVKNPPPSAPGRSALYQCNARGMRVHNCPQQRISASVIDHEVWARVCMVLRSPNLIAEQLSNHRDDAGLERDLTALDKRLESIATKQTNLARAIGNVDDPEPIYAQLNALSAAKKTLEADRAALVQRMADVAADAAKVRTLTDWCGHVAAKLDNATYEQKRQALEALGVDVRVYRVGATDDAGNPLPRWQMFMRPLALGEPIVYGQAHSATYARPSPKNRRAPPRQGRHDTVGSPPPRGRRRRPRAPRRRMRGRAGSAPRRDRKRQC